VTVRIGTSGWQYRDWRGTFYPRRLAQARWLEAYADAFATVESNNAFYRLPERHVFEAWAGRTPDDFVMAVKLSRFVTHVRRLRDPAEPVQRFLDRAAGLGDKLGPVLIQLPPQFHADHDRLAATLERFPREVRVAVEFRHDSWFTDETRTLLARHGAALCLADRRGLLTPLWRTTDWTYLRFHEGRASPRPCYGRASLRTWVERLRDGWGVDAESWVYFNNDPRGCAPRDAARFAGLAARAGLRPSRTPATRTIHLRAR
jgi:uncharacterized protein YecE (DUF72 family)